MKMRDIVVLAVPDLHHQCRTIYVNGMVGHWNSDQVIGDILNDYLEDGYTIHCQSSFSTNGIAWTLIKDR